MDYQKIACWGDSQTYGARTYGCYPLYLTQLLNRDTHYVWQALNLSTNGHTARDLWFRLGPELMGMHDVHIACVLIGANDVGEETPLDIFEEYLQQVLDALRIHGFRVTFCGEIPPVWPDGHAFFPAETVERRAIYNESLRKIVRDRPSTVLVELGDLSADCYTDPVHFNESGNLAVARAFADAIREH
ncbi:SGNH/GDSL hydrolase family protein [Nocardioides mangrovi]|uniref:SGNH/GDSL hydrolase family protein n=1 Tax=Nocardioides mangrovi TaxID=2874580 RepID=A0ABS7U7S0_9ACTN|nr:SGNH/GDSL hydrolase family protein [Nocardioides mangrovi]MBZ5736897.1 SGNH/GDSL hydrolase family protein [Nocardioides mangrovi]